MNFELIPWTRSLRRRSYFTFFYTFFTSFIHLFQNCHTATNETELSYKHMLSHSFRKATISDFSSSGCRYPGRPPLFISIPSQFFKSLHEQKWRLLINYSTFSKCYTRVSTLIINNEHKVSLHREFISHKLQKSSNLSTGFP